MFERPAVRAYIHPMQILATLAAVLSLAALPALAEDVSPPETFGPMPAPEASEPPASADEGIGLIQEGAKLFFRSIIEDMEPQLQDLGQNLDQTMTELGPMLQDLGSKLGDLSNYEAPEVLPNGDILIRRKPAPDPAVPLAPEIGTAPQIDL